jgi:hypothetical protein
MAGDVSSAEQWFKIGDAVPSTPVKSFLPVRMTRDAREIPGQLRREPSRRAVP